MRAEWRCASIISGELSVIMAGTQLILPLSASSWDMPTLDVWDKLGFWEKRNTPFGYLILSSIVLVPGSHYIRTTVTAL